jgi:ribosomal protein S18 acetylase RimI-like enzyme
MIFDQTGHVYSTAVRPSHRRKGFGRRLFLNASEQSYGKLWLEVRSKNTGAIGFYQRIGMRIVGRVEGYYHGDDALIMILDGVDGSDARLGGNQRRANPLTETG